MIEMLRKPPPAFADIVRRHFWMKRDEICLQIQGWIEETRKLVEKTGSVKQMPQHLTLMEVSWLICFYLIPPCFQKNFENLVAEFHKMECPSIELQHCDSKFVRDHSAEKE
jgi:hypothetical protein